MGVLPGAGLIVATALLFGKPCSGWRASLGTIVTLVGLSIVGLSAAPLSYWYYGAAMAVTLTWLVSQRRQNHSTLRARSSRGHDSCKIIDGHCTPLGDDCHLDRRHVAGAALSVRAARGPAK